MKFAVFVILMACLLMLVVFCDWIIQKDNSWLNRWRRRHNNPSATTLFSLLYLNELDSSGRVVEQHKIDFIPQDGLTIGRYDSPEGGFPLADVLVEGNKHSIKYVSRLHAKITMDSKGNYIFHDVENAGNGSVLLTVDGEPKVIEHLNIYKHIGEKIYLGGYPEGVPISFTETDAIHKYSSGIGHVNEMEEEEIESATHKSDSARGKKYLD